MSIADNIAQVRERIAAAARRAGRSAAEIELMAVSKTVEPQRVAEAHAAGLRLFGENRVQEFADKRQAVRLPGTRWHLIGHLQTNKAGKAAELFDAIESVDSARLAEKLASAAEQHNRNLEVLIEINTGGEAAKSGLAAGSPELESILGRAPDWKNLRFTGLMAIPPFSEDPQQARPYFRHLRELRDSIARRGLPAVRMDVLSMGMSHDFEVAIEEGATRVRLGTAIFGQRPRP